MSANICYGWRKHSKFSRDNVFACLLDWEVWDILYLLLSGFIMLSIGQSFVSMAMVACNDELAGIAIY